MTKYQIVIDLLYPIFSPIIILFLKWLIFDVICYKCPLKMLNKRIYNFSKEPLAIHKIVDSNNQIVASARNAKEPVSSGVILTYNDSILLNYNSNIKFIKITYLYKGRKKIKTIKIKKRP